MQIQTLPIQAHNKNTHQSEEIVEKDKEEDFYESDVDFDEIEDDSLTDMEN